MSKMDALRAMREARYAQDQARAAQRSAPPRVRPQPTPRPAEASTPPAHDAEAQPDDELCGHRNMSGRTCTRERGHAAKSHRYS
ncbi:MULTISPECIES: hypothetical protein [Nocardioides]|uniref:Uncharacterized protein n=1 Tax=Nocardioides vastitatis TaxID=2568655 RepID=A0ABW0ZQ65_9ACTN|nr:hypothetical protein [Nocardioides sp.]THI94362.1 hypothetical protein E7Z54_19975 [Nocardioides sp.]